MVALHAVEDELPVALEHEGVVAGELELLELRHGGANLALEPAGLARERGCAHIEIDERYVQELFDLDLGQAKLARIEAGHVLEFPAAMRLPSRS